MGCVFPSFSTWLVIISYIIGFGVTKVKKLVVMGDRYDISVDIGDGKDYGVEVTLYHIEYKNGEIGCNYIISNVKVCYERV